MTYLKFGLFQISHLLDVENFLSVSFPGVVTNLNNNESNSKEISANVSTFLINDSVLGSLFFARYKYKPLKYGLIKYPVCIFLQSQVNAFLSELSFV